MQTQVFEQARTLPHDLPETERQAPPAQPGIEQEVEFIRQDALTGSKEYVDEVSVPYGGE